MNIPAHLKSLIQSLRQLPSLGPRQATRLAFYLTGAGRAYGQQLARDLAGASQLATCTQCFFVCETGQTLCSTCADTSRNQRIVMIIEKETDLLSIEDAGVYRGTYCVLGPMPKTGVLPAWQQERLNATKKRITATHAGTIDEIIIGFGPSALGDLHAGIIKKELTGYAKKISRLGRGLPTGAEIEFADPETLSASLESRI